MSALLLNVILHLFIELTWLFFLMFSSWSPKINNFARQYFGTDQEIESVKILLFLAINENKNYYSLHVLIFSYVFHYI